LVRRLKKPLFTKGYKQIWTATTFTISEINGVNAVLDDGVLVKLNDLQRVTATEREAPEVRQVKKVERKAKIRKELKTAGVDKSQIAPGVREKRVSRRAAESPEQYKR